MNLSQFRSTVRNARGGHPESLDAEDESDITAYQARQARKTKGKVTMRTNKATSQLQHDQRNRFTALDANREQTLPADQIDPNVLRLSGFGSLEELRMENKRAKHAAKKAAPKMEAPLVASDDRKKVLALAQRETGLASVGEMRGFCDYARDIAAKTWGMP